MKNTYRIIDIFYFFFYYFILIFCFIIFTCNFYTFFLQKDNQNKKYLKIGLGVLACQNNNTAVLLIQNFSVGVVLWVIDPG